MTAEGAHDPCREIKQTGEQAVGCCNTKASLTPGHEPLNCGQRSGCYKAERSFLPSKTK